MSQTFYRIDTFTDKPFTGNPAPVFILPEPRDETWMGSVAGELNVSETAFLHHRPDGDWDLRWFTPTREVELCGHATLASAHILWETERLSPEDDARFHTASGPLVARRRKDWIELDLPALPEQPAQKQPKLVTALGVVPRYLGFNGKDYLVVLDSEEAVREVKPNFNQLRRLPGRGVIITSAADCPEYDFISRFFAPKDGIDEDPFSGSSHCCLGPYWYDRLGKKKLVAYQASARGGFARLWVEKDRVYLSGKALTVVKGELLSA